MRDFWPLEIRRVQEAYPAFQLCDRPPRPALDPDDAERCGAVVRTWRGRMQPFAPELDRDELLAIISDLYDGRQAISIDLNGTLRHNAGCSRRSHPLPSDLVPQAPVTATYEMEIAYAVPPMRPIVRAISARVTVREYPRMPQPIAPLNALCVANAPTDPWDLRSHGALRYLDWTAYFMAKHTLWLECFNRKGEADWPGHARSGDPDDELERNPPDAPCTCNSGIPYRHCHRAFDLENRNRIRQGLPVWSRPLSMQFYRSLQYRRDHHRG